MFGVAGIPMSILSVVYTNPSSKVTPLFSPFLVPSLLQLLPSDSPSTRPRSPGAADLLLHAPQPHCPPHPEPRPANSRGRRGPRPACRPSRTALARPPEPPQWTPRPPVCPAFQLSPSKPGADREAPPLRPHPLSARGRGCACASPPRGFPLPAPRSERLRLHRGWAAAAPGGWLCGGPRAACEAPRRGEGGRTGAPGGGLGPAGAGGHRAASAQLAAGRWRRHRCRRCPRSPRSPALGGAASSRLQVEGHLGQDQGGGDNRNSDRHRVLESSWRTHFLEQRFAVPPSVWVTGPHRVCVLRAPALLTPHAHPGVWREN